MNPSDPADIMRRVQAQLESAGAKDMNALQAVVEEWEERAKTCSDGGSNASEMPRFSVLAHEWGTLRPDAPQRVIDETLQTFIKCSLEALERRVKSGETLTWDTVVETFNQNPYMQRDEGLTTEVAKTFQTRRRRRWGFGGRSEKDEEIAKDLETWIKFELVTDTNIFKATKVHVERVANIVARTGPISYKHIQLSNATARNGLDFIDVGIIRYPDFTNPYIQLYRICLNAWTSCKPTALGLMHDSRSGVNGRLLIRTYRPNKESIQDKLDSAKKRALATGLPQRSVDTSGLHLRRKSLDAGTCSTTVLFHSQSTSPYGGEGDFGRIGDHAAGACCVRYHVSTWPNGCWQGLVVWKPHCGWPITPAGSPFTLQTSRYVWSWMPLCSQTHVCCLRRVSVTL
ncbi:hypothetical protein FA13DRAFT_1527432 [Coprinellus micaceus]|uniref:Uncharacterized protein n=1 Tax=Coprinellus micaceus TaxID=71717 RepID=A0A4Y7SK07_COPMI|nr:hypothetical protein FA13DRAFT_1527432 [Coprinellus micaceus]